MCDSSSESVSDGSRLSDWAMVDRQGGMEDEDSISSSSSVEVVDDADDPAVAMGTSPQPQFVLRLPSHDHASLESDEETSENEGTVHKSDSFDVIGDGGKRDFSPTEGGCHQVAQPSGTRMTSSQVVRNEDIVDLVAALDKVKNDLPLILSRSTSKELGRENQCSFDCGYQQSTHFNMDTSIGQGAAEKRLENLTDDSEIMEPMLNTNLSQSTNTNNTDVEPIDEERLFGTGDLLAKAVSETTSRDIPVLSDDGSMQSSISSTFSFLPKTQTQESGAGSLVADSQADEEDNVKVGEKEDIESETDLATESQLHGETHIDPEAGNQTGDSREEYPTDDIDDDEEEEEDGTQSLLAIDTLLEQQLQVPRQVEEGEDPDENTDLVEETVRVLRSWRRDRSIFLLTLIFSLILWTGMSMNFGMYLGRTSRAEEFQNLQGHLRLCTNREQELDQAIKHFQQQLDQQHDGFTKSYGTCRKLLYESDGRNSYLWSEITKLRYTKPVNEQDTFTNTKDMEDEDVHGEEAVIPEEETVTEEEEEEDGVEVEVAYEDMDGKVMFEGFDDGSFPDENEEVKTEDTVVPNEGSTTDDVKSQQCRESSQSVTSNTETKADSSCQWCFNELNVLREKWMKEKTERETETARAQMWMDLYKEERESCLQLSRKKNEKTLNLHNCWKYLTENFTASADFFQSLGMTWNDIQSLWPDQILSTFEYLMRNKKQQTSEPPRSESPDWDTDFDEEDGSSGEKEGSQSRSNKDSWTESVNDMLNKTKSSVSSVNKQIKETWNQVKNMSKTLWSKHKPAIYSIQKSFTQKIAELSKKYEEKLVKKTQSWFRKAKNSSDKKQTNEDESYSDSGQQASTKRREHSSKSSTSSETRGSEPDTSQQSGNNGMSQEKRIKHILKVFKGQKEKIEALNYKKFMNLKHGKMVKIQTDLQSIQDDSANLYPGLSDQQENWLRWQLDFWTRAITQTTDQILTLPKDQPCWQAKVLFGRTGFRACRENREELQEEEDEEVDWVSQRAKVRESQREQRESDDYLNPDLDWFSLRAKERDQIRGHFESMSGKENTDWSYELGREREYLRRNQQDYEEDAEEGCDPDDGYSCNNL